MSQEYRWGLLFGTVFAIVLVVLLLIRSRQTKTKTAEFDERQLVIRGKAYQYAFFTSVAAAAVLLFLDLFDLAGSLSIGSAALIIMFAGLLVFVDYCIFHDAFYSLKDKNRTYLLLCAWFTFSYGVSVIVQILDGQLTAGGDFRFVAYAVCFVFYADVLIALGIKAFADRKEGAADEEV